MPAIIDWLISTASNLLSIITGNWFLMVLIGIFLIGAVAPIIFKLFKK